MLIIGLKIGCTTYDIDVDITDMLRRNKLNDNSLISVHRNSIK
jgi:hypothetical protein